MTAARDALKPATAWPAGWGRDHYYTGLWQRLAVVHGRDRANDIARGEDAATNADLAAWRNLGARR